MEKINRAAWPGWETVRLIGRGSFGAVYEIERDNYGHKEKAALKVISIPQSASDIDDLVSDGYDEESITSRFEGYMQDIVREYSMMADMKGCANIVYCDDWKSIQHDDGMGWDIFIKMELLTALPRALGKTITDEQVIRIGMDICNALAFCESRNLLHRDIKPQNIFVAPDGTYKLGDFGIAKTAERTTSGTKTGTYKYMAPEVYNNQPYGGKADIYSLGLVLYWLLNERRTPFLPLPPATPTSTEEDKARAKRFGGELISAPAHGSKELQRIVLKACVYDPKERYQSAEEMLNDLQILGGIAPRAVVVNTRHDEDTSRRLFPDEDEATASIAYRDTEQGEDQTVGVFHTQTSAKSVQQPLDQESEENQTVGAFSPPIKAQEQRIITDVPQKSKKSLIVGILTAVMIMAGILAIVLMPKNSKSTGNVISNTGSAVIAAPTATAKPTANPTDKPTSAPEGENWDFSLEDGVLTITGTGDMKNFNQGDYVPWCLALDEIRQVVIKEGITGIGDNAFDFCKRLESVVIPDSVTYIGNGAFADCQRLEVVTIPGSVTYIGDRAFFDCYGLTSVTIPESVTYIGKEAFYSCFGLKAVTIPDSVTYIGRRAFSDCVSLAQIDIPSSVTYIGDEAFLYCDSLMDIYYTGTPEQWNEIEIGADNDPLFIAIIQYDYK